MKRMKPLGDASAQWLCAGALAWALMASGGALPGEWQSEQQFDVPVAGLVKLSLPVETLDRARPGLEDLRLYDLAGSELPYLIERPGPSGKLTQRPMDLRVSLNRVTTVVTIETGVEQPLEGITLESDAPSFIKAVDIAGSSDGKTWQTLAQRQPIFRQPGGASQLNVVVPDGVWPWLQLTIDDRRSPPLPFSGAVVHARVGQPSPSQEVAVKITERHENPGQTRLTLNLGAANLDLSTIRVETPDALFTRSVTVAVPRIAEDSIREETLAQGALYRVAIEGQPASASLSLPVERQVRSRELLLLIQNQDSPPLSITAVRAERRPVYLVFLARQAGGHYLLTGNSHCAAPRYDLAAFVANFQRAAVQPIQISPAKANPDYHPPEVLPGIQGEGATLDISAWRFRKPVETPSPGVQQVELDLQVLSHAETGFQDLRLLRDGRQVPYILEHTSITRSLAPVVSVANDPKDPKLSRWILKLPQAGLPITRLTCSTRTQLFQREVTIGEDLIDERGEKYRRTLGSTTWFQTPDYPHKVYSLTLDSPLKGDTLVLQTHNGDNPPIELEDFQCFYPATRVLFKAKSGDELFLHYGNPEASPPQYDLSLVAGQVLAADKSIALLGHEKQLNKGTWRDSQTGGRGGLVFWGVLGLVVAVLLVIISRLLPKSPEPAEDPKRL